MWGDGALSAPADRFLVNGEGHVVGHWGSDARNDDGLSGNIETAMGFSGK